MRFSPMILIAAGLISSASALNISSTCQSALVGLATSPAGQCLNVAGLLPLATLPDSNSVIPPLDTWLQGLCLNGPTCTNGTLQTLGQNLTTACGQDLESAGLPASIVKQLPSLITQYYSVVVQALCIRNTNDTTPNEAFCGTSELAILQNGIGSNLTTQNIVSSLVSVLSNTTLEKEIACTSCVQGIYAVVRPQLSSSIESEVESTLNSLCGSGFAVTTTPSGIVEATGSLATQTPTSSPPSSSSGAASTLKDSNTLSSKLAIAGLTLFAGVLGGSLGALHL